MELEPRPRKHFRRLPGLDDWTLSSPDQDHLGETCASLHLRAKSDSWSTSKPNKLVIAGGRGHCSRENMAFYPSHTVDSRWDIATGNPGEQIMRSHTYFMSLVMDGSLGLTSLSGLATTQTQVGV